MNNYFNSTRSNEELQERIDNRQNYMPETVEAAIDELLKRGHTFTDEELQVINDDLKAHRSNANLVGTRMGAFSSEYKNAIVDDPDAPLMYSRRVVYIFTILFGALFGSIMLAMNVGKTERKINFLWVVLFGLSFSTLQIYITETILSNNSPGSIGIIWGFVSAVILDGIFWGKFIGYSKFYRARPIWGPLAVALVIIGLLIWIISRPYYLGHGI